MMMMVRLLACFICCFVDCVAAYKIHLSSAWYPEKRANLLSALAQHDEYAKQHYFVDLDPLKIRAMIVPHAGFAYSGNVAAAAYRLLPYNFFKRIIILAPSHYEYFKGIGLPDKKYDSYKNVLGEINLDKPILNALAHDADWFSYKGHAHELDHAVNVQIPFVQRYCGMDCKLVPLLVGDITIDQADIAAAILHRYVDEHTLVIVSSDFTHYGPRFSYEPFKGSKNLSGQIQALDSALVATIQDQNLESFDGLLRQTGATVCGQNPIRLLLAMINRKNFGAVESYVVGYDSSDAAQPNVEHSVSYVSCIFSNQLQDGRNYITGYEKNLLLKVARNRVDELIHDPSAQYKKNDGVSGLLTNALQQKRGAFVSLYTFDKKGYKDLRGCIGKVMSDKPLYETVYDMATAVALHDNRFKRLDKQELPYTDISISILSDPKDISSYRDIVLGRDGVVLKNDAKSAVYLPKVAIEQGWNVEQMLDSLSQKAGLASTAWKDKNTKYQTFFALDFAEDKDPLELMYEGYKK